MCPRWLKPLLEVKNFYDQCRFHADLRKTKCRMHFYCLDCINGALCSHCLSAHPAHRILQIRKLSHMNTVRASEIEEYLDIGGVHRYIVNKDVVVFLNEQPAPAPAPASNAARGAGACEVCCHIFAKDPARFCSLRCKFGVSAATLPPPAPSSLRRKKRKGMPRRSPLY